jgi:hypothetical protein
MHKSKIIKALQGAMAKNAIGLTFKHNNKKCAHMKYTNDYKCTMRKSIRKKCCVACLRNAQHTLKVELV